MQIFDKKSWMIAVMHLISVNSVDSFYVVCFWYLVPWQKWFIVWDKWQVSIWTDIAGTGSDVLFVSNKLERVVSYFASVEEVQKSFAS